MIGITQNKGKWRIKITKEIWEFGDKEIFKVKLNELITLKEDFGKIKDEN